MVNLFFNHLRKRKVIKYKNIFGIKLHSNRRTTGSVVIQQNAMQLAPINCSRWNFLEIVHMFSSGRRSFEVTSEAEQSTGDILTASLEASDHTFRHANKLFCRYSAQHLIGWERLQKKFAFHLSIGRVLAAVQVSYNCLSSSGPRQYVVYIEGADCATACLHRKIESN